MSHLVKLLFLLTLTASLGIAQRDVSDLDSDGYPDITELHSTAERDSFMRWFAAIAEAQYTAPSPTWKAEDQDCSGLLRFAYIEALKPKTLEWFKQFAYFPDRDIPPLKTLSYPLPLISRSIFRVAPGRYKPDDVEQGRLVGRTTAEYMMNFSTVFLGRTPDKARRGDLLFFVHPLARGSAYHSMVYLGNGRVVYHTGLSPQEGGEVRLLTLDTLNKHPSASWHPVPENPNFLGFFRWKIVANSNNP
ncbi:MAG: DUF1175 family protein [Thermaceae bacterium]|nr:DUF1175 family protein [Thermaceae bacterium]